MMRSPIGWRRSPQARFSGGNTLWAGYRIYVEGVLMAWTDERIDQLKSMWEKGMTASQIADELGGVSRNAVIGKAHRLGLQSRPSPVKAGEGRKNAASKRHVAKKTVAEAEKPSAVPASMPKPTPVAAFAAAPRATHPVDATPVNSETATQPQPKPDKRTKDTTPEIPTN